MTKLCIECWMLLINCDTAGDKRFLKFVSTGFDESVRFNISEFVNIFQFMLQQ